MAELTGFSEVSTDQVLPMLCLDIHRRAVLPQPFLALSVVRHDLVNLVPESFRVIEVVEVAQLVDNDVVDDSRGSHHALPVKRKIALRRNRSPSVADVSNVN